MVTISEIYDYPVTITDEDFEKYTGVSLKTELNNESETIIQDWLNCAHENIYNEIYKIGGSEFKNRLIKNNLATLKNTIIKCLCVELKYMLDANGDYGSYDGSNTSADGVLNIVPNDSLRAKILAPKVKDILKSARPNLILGD